MGRTLREFRHLVDMSLRQVSEASGLAKGELSAIENGREPRISTALRISRWAEEEAICMRLPKHDWLDWSYFVDAWKQKRRQRRKQQVARSQV